MRYALLNKRKITHWKLTDNNGCRRQIAIFRFIRYRRFRSNALWCMSDSEANSPYFGRTWTVNESSPTFDIRFCLDENKFFKVKSYCLHKQGRTAILEFTDYITPFKAKENLCHKSGDFTLSESKSESTDIKIPLPLTWKKKLWRLRYSTIMWNAKNYYQNTVSYVAIYRGSDGWLPSWATYMGVLINSF